MTILRTATIFAEGIFEGETLVIHPSTEISSVLEVALFPPKDAPLDIHIRVGKHQRTLISLQSQDHPIHSTRSYPVKST